MSLLFVIATMLEFAAVLFLKRKMDLKKEMWMKPNNEMKKNVLFELESLIAWIDIGALITFFICYVVFNIAYWASYHNYSA